MSVALVTAGLLMGLAGSPHCLAMCAAPCAAVERLCGGAGGRAATGLQLGRLVSYAVAGAAAGLGAGWMAAWAGATAWLAPLWTLLQAGALGWGLWMLATGLLPRWRLPAPGVAMAAAGTPVVAPLRIMRWSAAPGGPAPVLPTASRGGWRAAAIGLGWAAWPCGWLYAALVLAALAGGPAGGAAVMAAFALGGGLALRLGRGLWRRAADSAAWVRLSGALLAAASVWALWQRLSAAGAAWCAPA